MISGANLYREHPAPWWFLLALRLCPGRCREIPEPRTPERILMRQVAIVKRYVYLQQFASSEDPRYMHSHQWRWTIAIGLWGGYSERRIAGRARWRRAPYLYVMDDSIVHHVQYPTAGHTSLFIGLWRDDALKHYYGTPQTYNEPCGVVSPARTRRVPWDRHIRKMVKRI